MAGAAVVHKVVAKFPNMRAAQEASGALEWKGIDALRISVEGEPVEEAATKPRPIEGEKRAVTEVLLRAATGAAGGAVLGAFIGGLLALFEGFPFGIWASMLWGASGGFLVGGIIGAESILHVTPYWELTFEPGDRPVMVTVVSDDPSDIARAAEVLRLKGLLEVRVD